MTPTTKTATPMCARCMPKKLRGWLEGGRQEAAAGPRVLHALDEVEQGGGDDPGGEQQAEGGQRLTIGRKPAAGRWRR